MGPGRYKTSRGGIFIVELAQNCTEDNSRRGDAWNMGKKAHAHGGSHLAIIARPLFLSVAQQYLGLRGFGIVQLEEQTHACISAQTGRCNLQASTKGQSGFREILPSWSAHRWAGTWS